MLYSEVVKFLLVFLDLLHILRLDHRNNSFLTRELGVKVRNIKLIAAKRRLERRLDFTLQKFVHIYVGKPRVLHDVSNSIFCSQPILGIFCKQLNASLFLYLPLL